MEAPVEDFTAQVSGISALAEPARRALYLYVAAQPEPVSRDQAATATGVPRHTAKFHLDRLVEEGLLATEFRRLSGRRGPGAGRPSKLYRRSGRQLAVTLPERHYELAAELLANAVEDADRHGTPIHQALQRVARSAGRGFGAEARQRSEVGHTDRAPLESVADVLAAHGYEPRRHADTLLLANCPFDALARNHTQLVCGMNLDLIRAVLDETNHADELTARLDPAPGRCCVTVAPADPSATGGSRRDVPAGGTA
jgi:predicted ArsR family transcriptional regulator